MKKLKMPKEREFGWQLKPTSSAFFKLCEKDNGQFACVLNHSLLRGVTSEMIFWWFQHFQNMKVILEDVEGYEGKTVPVYLLWHPSDHLNVSLKGKDGNGFKAEAGDTIHIQEAMQYKTFGWKYPVDSALKVFYCGPDGWAMGKTLPILGDAMVLRIHYKDVVENGKIIGVHYHYEVVIGLSGDDFISRFVTKKLTAKFSPEFFEAWCLHNTIEVGTFENFLPALFAQKDNINSLRYSTDMDPVLDSTPSPNGFSEKVFNERLQGYESASDLYDFQAYKETTFL